MVFDECHNAVGNSPMASIMKDAYMPLIKEQSEQCPRVVGLTASFVSGSIKQMDTKRQQLEALMHASIFSPDVPVESNPQFETVLYARERMNLDLDDFVRNKIEQLTRIFERETGLQVDMKKPIDHARHVLEELGMSAFLFLLFESYLPQLEAKVIENARLQGTSAEWGASELKEIRKKADKQAQRLQQEGALVKAPFVTNKCKALLELVGSLLKESLPTDQDFKGIVFVEQVGGELHRVSTHIQHVCQHLQRCFL